MKRLGANASRRVARRLGSVKCPRCRQRYLGYFRKTGVVACGVCGCEPTLEQLPSGVVRELSEVS